jgi:mannosyltransferase
MEGRDVPPRQTPSVLARAPGAAPPQGAGPAQGAAAQGAGPGLEPRFDGGPVWMRLLPALVMLGLALWRITVPSYWRDEGATLAAVQRPFGQLLRMLGHVDAVHGAYYMIMWPLVRLAGPGELITRLPSALAMVVAAGLVAALGRRLVSPAAGLASGLIFAVFPQISLYAQDARSYAMVTALGTAGSYLLVRAIGTPGRRRGWLTGYAVCMGAMGALNIFGLLLVAAHAVPVALACLRGDDGRIGISPAGLRGQQDRTARSLALGWLAAATGAVATASPVLALGIEQRGAVSWIMPPAPGTVTSLWRLVGQRHMVIAVGLLTVCGLAASVLAGRLALRTGWPPVLLVLAVPWLAVPPAILIGISLVTPLYVPRYVLYCLPAAALLTGAALAALSHAAGAGLGRAPGAGAVALGWATGAAVLGVIVLLGAGTQINERGPAGHNDNIRLADQIVAANMRPGDAVLYETSNNLWAAYPSGLARLANIAQYQTPARSGTLAGTVLPAAVVRQRIAGTTGLWVVEWRPRSRVPLLQGLGLRLVRTWHAPGLWLFRYARGPAD